MTHWTPETQVPTLLSSCMPGFCLGSLPCWEGSLPSGKRPAHLGPAQLTQALVSRGFFFPPLPHYTELLPLFPTLQRVVLYYLETPAAKPHTSGQSSGTVKASHQQLRLSITSTWTLIWTAGHPWGTQPIAQFISMAILHFFPLQTPTCCWDPSVCQHQLGRVPTPVMPACSEMPPRT